MLWIVIVVTLRGAVLTALGSAGVAPAFLVQRRALLVPSLSLLALTAAGLALLMVCEGVRRAAGLASRQSYLAVFAVSSAAFAIGAGETMAALLIRSHWAGLVLMAALLLLGLAAASVDEPENLPPRQRGAAV